MKTAIERPVITCGKDENIMSMVVFPCNEEDLKERFQVSDLVKELKFVDVPESKVSIRALTVLCWIRPAVVQSWKSRSTPLCAIWKNACWKIPSGAASPRKFR